MCFVSVLPPRPCRSRSIGQRPDDQIAPQSIELLKQGETLLAQGKFIEADDALETALVVDPKNRAAFTAMARVAIKEKLSVRRFA